MSQRIQQLAVKEQASKQQQKQDIKQQGIQEQRINTTINQPNTIQQSLNQRCSNSGFTEFDSCAKWRSGNKS